MLRRFPPAVTLALVAGVGLVACHPTRPRVSGPAPSATASPWITDAREDGRMVTVRLSAAN